MAVVVVEAELAPNILLGFVVMQQVTAGGSRRAVKMTSCMEVCMKRWCATEFLHAEKKCTHGHSYMLSVCLWRPKKECKHSEVCFCSHDNDIVSDFYERDMQALVHWQ